MRAVLILFDIDKKKIISGGIDSDRFIEIDTPSVVTYVDVEKILDNVGLSARNVDYKLLGYNTSIWVPDNSKLADVVSEYVVTGVVYSSDNLKSDYGWVSSQEFISKAEKLGNYRRLEYLQKSLRKLEV